MTPASAILHGQGVALLSQLLKGLWAPLRGTNKWWRNGREREAEGFGHNKDRQNWRPKVSKEETNVSSQ